MSIGFAPADGEVDDSIKLAISRSIVNGLGYTNNQWIAIAHGRNDPGHDWQHDHDHMHIVINGIDFNGKPIYLVLMKQENLFGTNAAYWVAKILTFGLRLTLVAIELKR